jgi:hypothetical protein
MDLVTCKCSACDAKLDLNIANRWTRIGKNYLTPDAEPVTRDLPISTSGDILFGEKGTLIAGWYNLYSSPLLTQYTGVRPLTVTSELRRAQCASCGENLGLKCLNTPVNHVFRP